MPCDLISLRVEPHSLQALGGFGLIGSPGCGCQQQVGIVMGGFCENVFRNCLFGDAYPVHSLQQLLHVPDLFVAGGLADINKRFAVLVIQRTLK